MLVWLLPPLLFASSGVPILLIKPLSVSAVPNEVFYDNKTIGKPLVRFAYCKRPEVLDHAVEKLLSLKD